tara:strand:+ start:57 stop:413 length:357 start_codon:yes stop_codon:yes gene_type:complete
MGKLIMGGSKKKKKKPGLGKVKPKHSSVFKNKKKKKKKKKNKYTSKNIIYNPFKTRRKRNLPLHIESYSMMDTSSYSNVMGKQGYKRKMRKYKYNNGKESEIHYDQDNDTIIIKRYPN